jgi:thioesterase domain-containing protein/acyl carrier protein
LLVVENYPVGSAAEGSMSGVTPEQFEYHGAQTQHPFTLLVSPGNEMTLHAVVDTRYVDGGSADRMLDHLARLMTAVANGEDSIAGLIDRIREDEVPYFHSPETNVRRQDAGESVAPRDDIELRLAGIWQRALAVPEIGVRDDFFALGGHSLLVLQLVNEIRSEFGRQLPLTTIFGAPTIEALASTLRASADPGDWSPLVAIQPVGSRPPLYCVHPLGGNVICYADLARLLPSDQPLFGLQAPGIEEGQQPHANLSDMAAAYVRTMRAHQPSGPYALAGYSFGGYVVYEMAQQLTAAGETVALVALLDTPAPSVIRQELLDTDSAELLSSLFPILELSVPELRAVGSEDDQLALVMDRAQQANLVPPGFTLAEARRYFDVCKLNHRMRPDPQPYRGRVTLLRASEGADRISADPALGWQSLALGGLDLHWVDGRHEDMLAASKAGSTAHAIIEALASAGVGVL